MGSHLYRENYLAALEVAHSDIDQIFQECEMLQLRKGQLENRDGSARAIPSFRRVPSTSQFTQSRSTLNRNRKSRSRYSMCRRLSRSFQRHSRP